MPAFHTHTWHSRSALSTLVLAVLEILTTAASELHAKMLKRSKHTHAHMQTHAQKGEEEPRRQVCRIYMTGQLRQIYNSKI